MTCIVAVAHEGKVWMGGDSAGVDGSNYNLIARKDKKVCINGEYIIGFTSSFRMGDLLKWSFKPPKPPKKEDKLEKFMTTNFIDVVSKLFFVKGYEKNDAGQKSAGTFGVRGLIFNIADDYQVGMNNYNFDACGCGQQVALGSLFTSEHLKPEDRVLKALEAATAFSAGVRGPYNILCNK